MMNDQELHAYCEAWCEWCRTRNYFIVPGAKNILARMQPSKVGRPPNAVVSANLSFFNMAIHALADMGDANTECFVKYYCERVKNIKAIADSMEIGTRTFYDRKTRFARRAYSMSLSLKRVQQESMEGVLEEAMVD